MAFDTFRRIDNEYKISRKLSSGGQGSVYLAKNRDGYKYAVKASRGQSSLTEEHEMYERLGCTQRSMRYFPSVYLHTTHGNYAVMVMTYFNKSLQDMKRDYHNRLSMPCVLKAGINLIKAVKEVHSKGILHLDMKPANVMIRTSGQRKNRLHVIDFGMSRFYIDPTTNRHVSNSRLESFEGTDEFASRRSHSFKMPSRRDDLESLGYVLLYLAKGELPWSNIRRSTSSREFRAIGHMKKHIPLEVMCHGTVGILEYMKEVGKLSFKEKPDYSRMTFLFERALVGLVGNDAPRYDWE